MCNSSEMAEYCNVRLLLLLLLIRFSRAGLCEIPQMAAHQAPPSLGFSSKNTGVGCYFLLQCMKMKSESEVAQLCLTFSDPMDCSLPGSSVHRIFQARVLEWGAIAFSEHLTINPNKFFDQPNVLEHIILHGYLAWER